MWTVLLTTIRKARTTQNLEHSLPFLRKLTEALSCPLLSSPLLICPGC